MIEIIDSYVPSTVLPRKSTVLQHWDINDYNVLVDEGTGQRTALLDWEQSYTVPLTHVRPYYSTVFEFLDDTMISKCSRRPSTSWLPEECLSSHQPVWEAEPMQKAFDERLDELKSPWLIVEDNGGSSGDLCRAKEQQCQGTDPVIRRIYSKI